MVFNPPKQNKKREREWINEMIAIARLEKNLMKGLHGRERLATQNF